MCCKYIEKVPLKMQVNPLENAVKTPRKCTILESKNIQKTLQSDQGPLENAETPLKCIEVLEKDENVIAIEKDIAKTEGKKFRLKGKKVFFTYKTHINFDELFNAINKKHPISKYMFCHESADQNDPYLHTHGCVEFIKPIDTVFSRIFDIGDIHPNFTSTRNWCAAINYCMKEFKETKQVNFKHNMDLEAELKSKRQNKLESRNEFKQLVQLIVEEKNALDAIMNYANDLRDVMAITMLHNLKQQGIPEDILRDAENFVPSVYHEELIEIMKSIPSIRTAYWLYDEFGNTGKSTFMKWCIATMKDVFAISGTGASKDIFNVLLNHLKEKEFPKTIFIDLARTCEDRESIYGIIEQIKNGYITATKYHGGNIFMPVPHIIILSNFLPIVSKLSLDRWRIYEVYEDVNDNYSMARLNLKQVSNMRAKIEAKIEAKRIVEIRKHNVLVGKYVQKYSKKAGLSEDGLLDEY